MGRIPAAAQAAVVGAPGSVSWWLPVAGSATTVLGFVMAMSGA